MTIRKKLFSIFILLLVFVSAFQISLQQHHAFSQETYSSVDVQNALTSSWNGYKTYYIQNGKVIRPDQGNDTVSEGQSYAMLRAVYMHDQQTFDQVWNWTKTNLSRMNNPDTANKDNLFAWHYNNGVLDWTSATDADEDIALSLLFAAKVWNNPQYEQDAIPIINDILSRDTVTAQNGRKYISGGSYAIYQASPDINISYLAPANYRIFAQATGNNTWNDIVNTSYDMFTQSISGAMNTNAGLFPNWAALNLTTATLFYNPNSGRTSDYTYDAFRSVYRLETDREWFNEPRAASLLTGKINVFFNNQWNANGQKIWAEYQHDGSVKNAYESPCIYGADLAVFMANQNTPTLTQIVAKIMQDYSYNNGQGYFGSTTTNYYGNNWEWFGLLMANGQNKNLFASAQTAAASGQSSKNVAKTPPANPITISVNNIMTVNQTVYMNLTINAPTNDTNTYLVDAQLTDPTNNKIKGNVITNNLFAQKANQSSNISWELPSNIPNGTYTISIGIYSFDWSTQYTWDQNAAQITIGS